MAKCKKCLDLIEKMSSVEHVEKCEDCGSHLQPTQKTWCSCLIPSDVYGKSSHPLGLTMQIWCGGCEKPIQPKIGG